MFRSVVLNEREAVMEAAHEIFREDQAPVAIQPRIGFIRNPNQRVHHETDREAKTLLKPP